MKTALKRHGCPERVATDGLRRYAAAPDELANREKQEIGRRANRRAENSHLPCRRRERAMTRFRRMSTPQKSASIHASLHNHFSLERQFVTRQTCEERRSAALPEWQLLVNQAGAVIDRSASCRERFALN